MKRHSSLPKFLNFILKLSRYVGLFAVSACIFLAGALADSKVRAAEKLYFTGTYNLKEFLWSSDGTEAGTKPLFEMPAGLHNFPTIYRNKLLFVAGFRPSDIWESDGTAAGTKALGIFDATPPEGVGASFFGFFPYKGKLLFRGRTLYQDAMYAWKRRDALWTTDGTKAGTYEIIVSGAALSGVSPSNFAEINGVALFQGASPGGGSLWRTDGTTAGTSEIYVDTGGTISLNPHLMTPYNGSIYFNGWTGNRPLIADAAAKNAMAVSDRGEIILEGLAGTLNANTPIVMEDSYKANLFKSDGTVHGTAVIPVPGVSAKYGLEPWILQVFKDKLFMSGINTANQNQLWVSDGTTAGTTELKIAGAGPFGLRPSWGCHAIYKDRLYFNGFYDETRAGLWSSDGTAAGTFRQVVNGEGTRPEYNGFYPCEFVVFNNLLFFAGNSLGSKSLWVSDGTTNGTKELTFNGSRIYVRWLVVGDLLQ